MWSATCPTTDAATSADTDVRRRINAYTYINDNGGIYTIDGTYTDESSYTNGNGGICTIEGTYTIE